MAIDVHFSSKSNEWRTPKKLFDVLNKEFHFELDAAATKENALCENFYTIEDDSLKQDWSRKYVSVWVNPPYGRGIKNFVKKAYEESQKFCRVVMLIPARVDTTWWHNYCSHVEVRFIKGRIKFYKESEEEFQSAPFPSAIVIFERTKIPKTLYINQYWNT